MQERRKMNRNLFYLFSFSRGYTARILTGEESTVETNELIRRTKNRRTSDPVSTTLLSYYRLSIIDKAEFIVRHLSSEHHRCDMPYIITCTRNLKRWLGTFFCVWILSYWVFFLLFSAFVLVFGCILISYFLFLLFRSHWISNISLSSVISPKKVPDFLFSASRHSFSKTRSTITFLCSWPRKKK